MKAAADAQRRLLDLQAVDTTIAQLRHRRSQLPEHAEVAAAHVERAALAEHYIAVRTRTSDLEKDQAKAEADLQPVKDRRVRNQKRVDDGSITDPKALRPLIEEIAHLGQRISDLEDGQLEIMERLEASQAEFAELSARRASGEDALRALLARRDEKLKALDAEIAERVTERDVIARAIPDDLLALYTKIAGRSGGTGAALLQHGRCGGCRLEATNADLNRYRLAAEDEVVRCVECDRILVRTAESGI